MRRYCQCVDDSHLTEYRHHSSKRIFVRLKRLNLQTMLTHDVDDTISNTEKKHAVWLCCCFRLKETTLRTEKRTEPGSHETLREMVIEVWLCNPQGPCKSRTKKIFIWPGLAGTTTVPLIDSEFWWGLSLCVSSRLRYYSDWWGLWPTNVELFCGVWTNGISNLSAAKCSSPC